MPGIESAAIGGLRQRWAASQRSHFVGGRLSHVDPWADLVGWGALCPLKKYGATITIFVIVIDSLPIANGPFIDGYFIILPSGCLT